MSLRNQALSGIRWTTASSLGRAFLQVAQIAILARLLTPTEFGQMAVVVAIAAFLQIFSDAGISNAIIHYRHLTEAQRSSLYWLNVGVSLVVALLLTVSAPWIAQWYREPVIRNLLMLAGLSLFAASLGQQLRVKAQKDLRFDSLAKVELAAVICGFVIAVCSAGVFSAGVYALAWGSLAASVASSCFSWLVLAGGWRPMWRLNVGEIRPFLSFGSYMVGNNLVNSFATQIDVLIGTRLFGANAMGAYTLSKNLTVNVQNVINPIVTQVGLPVMAKAQDDEQRLRRIYLQTIRMTASVNFPIYLAIAFFANDVVAIMLGEKWTHAVPLLQVFAFWGLFRSVGNPVGSLLFAKGRANLAFKWNVAILFFIAPALWIGSRYGLYSMAWTAAALMAALFVPGWYFLVRPLCSARFVEYAAQALVPFVLAAISVFLAANLSGELEPRIVKLLAAGVLGAVVYLFLSLMFNRPWIEAIRELLLRKNSR
jgi:O-antigen/teichoic acid export membrane protein